MIETKTVLIGAGVAGLSCALYLKRANVPFVLLDKGAPGGKLLTIPHIENFPGHDSVPGPDLAMDFLQSAMRFGVEFTYGDVKSVHLDNGMFVVQTDMETYRAPAVVVATGLANIPTIHGEKELMGKGVSYCATCDGPLFRGKEVAVYGRGDRALEEAFYLDSIASKVYFLTPDTEIEGSAMLLEKLASSKIEVIRGASVKEVLGTECVEGLEIEVNNEVKQLSLAAFFPLLGEKSASAFLSPLPLSLEKGFIVVDANQMSALPGLFAAGDIVKKSLRQVVTAASDGAIASSGVVNYLRRLPRV